MRFSEFRVGQKLTLGPVSLDAREIVDFARAHDPQHFHADPAAAARSHWGGLIASGWQTCALAMRLVCDNVLTGSESIGSPGLGYVKWPNPLRPGEPVTMHIEVLEVRRSVRKPELGILRWRWRLTHADGREALDLETTTMFELGA